MKLTENWADKKTQSRSVRGEPGRLIVVSACGCSQLLKMVVVADGCS